MCPSAAAILPTPTAPNTAATLKILDYGPNDNLVAGFTQRWLDRNRFVAKASEVYTVHEMEAAEVWAVKNGTYRRLAFEKWLLDDDGDGNANVPQQPYWASEMEVWGNYELGDGDMVHGWVADRPWDASRPNFEARVHGDGISGDYVGISSANKPRADLNAEYWCQVVPDTAAFRNLRDEIQQGLAWPKMLANIRVEPRDLPPLSNQDQEILQYVVRRHCQNPSQALAVRHVLDESASQWTSHASQH